MITNLVYWVLFCMAATIIHEAGHYITACAAGLKPDLFKLGIGKPIIRLGTLEIAALPVSGVVYFNDNQLDNAPLKTQRLIAAGGPAANLITGLITLPIIPVFGLLSLLAAVGNLIPFSFRNQKTDGGYIFGAMQLPVGLLLVDVTAAISAELVRAIGYI